MDVGRQGVGTARPLDGQGRTAARRYDLDRRAVNETLPAAREGQVVIGRHRPGVGDDLRTGGGTAAGEEVAEEIGDAADRIAPVRRAGRAGRRRGVSQRRGRTGAVGVAGRLRGRQQRDRDGLLAWGKRHGRVRAKCGPAGTHAHGHAEEEFADPAPPGMPRLAHHLASCPDRAMVVSTAHLSVAGRQELRHNPCRRDRGTRQAADCRDRVIRTPLRC